MRKRQEQAFFTISKSFENIYFYLRVVVKMDGYFNGSFEDVLKS